MKNAVLSIILSGLLVMTGTFFIIAKKSNSRLRAELKGATLKSDSLREGGKALITELAVLKKHTDSLSGENRKLETTLKKNQTLLEVEDRSLIRLSRSFEGMSKKCDSFLIRQKQWDKDKSLAQSTHLSLLEKNQKLMAQNDALTEANRKLNADLATAKLFEKDNISIVRLDKSDRPNIRAKKVKKIKVFMSLPFEIKSPEFKIFDPNGKMLASQDGRFVSTISKENNVFGSPAARLELTYLPSKLISSGSYRLEIANDGKSIGNLFMNLR